MTAHQLHLWSIGVDRYDHLTKLQYCASDCDLFVKTLTRFPNVLTRGVLRAPRDNADDCTYEQLDDALEEIRKANLTETDTALLYFAGHGVAVEGSDYLMCSDSELRTIDTVRENCMPVSRVVEALRHSSAGLAVLVMDACRRDAGRRAGPGEQFGRDVRERAKKQGVALVLGCEAGDICHESEAIEHGVFTYSLTAHLQEHGEFVPRLDEDRITERVREVCAELGLPPQNPEVVVSRLNVANLDLISGERRTLDVRPRRLVLIAGPANTGKSTVGPEVARQLGFTQVEMSSYAYARWNQARDAGQYSDNIQRYMEDIIWRENEADVIAQDLLEDNNGVNELVVCGPRRTEEIETFRDAGFDVHTVYLYTSSGKRFRRYLDMQPRGSNLEEFIRRDLLEYSWGLTQIGRMPNCGFQHNLEDRWQQAAADIVSAVRSRWPATATDKRGSARNA